MQQVRYVIFGSILTATLIGTVGCGNMTSSQSNKVVTEKNSQSNSTRNNQSQIRTPPPSSNRTFTVPKGNIPTMVIESIQPQPGGILIKFKKTVKSTMKDIVRSPRFDVSQLSFTLQNVRVTNPSIANVNKPVDNQLIYGLKVYQQGTDLFVAMTLDRTINTLNIGTYGSYLGIALQYKPNKPLPVSHRVGRIPSWFFKDILMAASVQGTPVLADTYGHILPYQSSDKTYMLKAPLTGVQETLGVSAYFGSLSLYENYFNMLKSNSNENLYSQVKYGVVRERKSDKWYGVKAIMVNMQNGWRLGFAKNQVIVENNHGGTLTYTVYPVQGIELDSPLQE